MPRSFPNPLLQSFYLFLFLVALWLLNTIQGIQFSDNSFQYSHRQFDDHSNIEQSNHHRSSTSFNQAFLSFLNSASIIDFITTFRGVITPALLFTTFAVLLFQYLLPSMASLRSEKIKTETVRDEYSKERRYFRSCRSDKRLHRMKVSLNSITDFSTESSLADGMPIPHPIPATLTSTSGVSSELEKPKVYGLPEESLEEFPELGTKEVRRNLPLVRKKKCRKPEPQKDEIKKVPEEVMIRDQWLTLIDSTDVPFRQLLIQLETGRSILLKGIKDFVNNEGNGGLKLIIDSILAEHRPVEAAGLLRLIAPVDKNVILKAEREQVAISVLEKLINVYQKLDGCEKSFSCGVKYLFDRSILNSPPVALTTGE